MPYSQGFGLHVELLRKSGGQTSRSTEELHSPSGDYVPIHNGHGYDIRLENDNETVADAILAIDGGIVGIYRLAPHSSLTIGHPQNNSTGFVFVNNLEDKNNGLIEVVFNLAKTNTILSGTEPIPSSDIIKDVKISVRLVVKPQRKMILSSPVQTVANYNPPPTVVNEYNEYNEYNDVGGYALPLMAGALGTYVGLGALGGYGWYGGYGGYGRYGGNRTNVNINNSRQKNVVVNRQVSPPRQVSPSRGMSGRQVSSPRRQMSPPRHMTGGHGGRFH